jgi:uncharacterized protein YggE
MAGRASGLEGAGLGIRTERQLYSVSSTVIVQTLAGQVRPPHDSGKQILPPTTLADSPGDMVRIVSRRKESLVPFVSLFFLVFLFMVLSSVVIAATCTDRSRAGPRVTGAVDAHDHQTRVPRGFPQNHAGPAQRCALCSRAMVNQSIHRPAGINVFGSYLVRIDPDFATLDFSVNATEASARSAFAKAREAAAAVRAFIGTASVPDADIRTSQMSLQQAFEYQAGQQRAIGFTAHIGFQVMMDALDRVELLLAGVVEAGANRVDRVAFRTSRMREVRADARRQAFANAKAKAELFAAAAGVKLGKVLHVEDVNPDDSGRRHSGYVPDLDMSEEDSDRAAANPGSIVVNAAVMACFSILP